MKKLISLVLFLLFTNSISAQTLISDELRQKFPQAKFKGVDSSGVACFVEFDLTARGGRRPSNFAASILSADAQIKVSYNINDTLYTAGRGDCPYYVADTESEIFVMNNASHAPCFSAYDHTNHGGLQVLFEPTVRHFNIYNDQKVLIRDCTISN